MIISVYYSLHQFQYSVRLIVDLSNFRTSCLTLFSDLVHFFKIVLHFDLSVFSVEFISNPRFFSFCTNSNSSSLVTPEAINSSSRVSPSSTL